MSTDVATREPITVDNVPAKVAALLRRLDVNASNDTTAAQLSIMAKIADAESEEEIFTAASAGTVNGQEFAGRPFLLKDYDVKRAAPGYIAQGAFPFYFLCDVISAEDGSEHVLVCGGFTFVSVIDALDRKGHLARYPDGYPLVLESRKMASGFDVLIPHKYTPPAPAAASKK